jgi:hypothetical protein
MQTIRFTLLLSLLGIASLTRAQFIVTGTVLDSASREPLVSASVFCQNTTLGTTTNKLGEFSLNLKSGGYDLIFSYTGYQTQTIRVTENNKLEILLIKEDKSLGEVVLKNTFEVTDGLSKYGDFFFKNFVGAYAQRCAMRARKPGSAEILFLQKKQPAESDGNRTDTDSEQCPRLFTPLPTRFLCLLLFH